MKVVVVVVVVVVMMVGIGLAAQDAKPPALDAGEIDAVQLVIALVQTEQIAKKRLEESVVYEDYKRANAERTKVQADRLARIEKAHPGYTIDWVKRTLVVKPPAQAK
jgi:hypothetical protein